MARSLKTILNNIHDMSKEPAASELFAMIYAEFGVGKTTTLMGLAQAIRGDGKILFLDSSDGFISLQEFPALMENTDRFRADDPKDLMVIANALSTGQLKGYSVVIIDELSSIFDVQVEQYLREKHGIGDDEQIPEAEGRDYGPPTAALASLLRKFHQIEGVHLLVSAHAREVQAEGGVKEIRASFPPKAYHEVMRKTHVTAALTARRKRDPKTKQLGYERTLQLKPSAAIAAKSRIRRSPVTVSPQEFIDLVVEWLGSEQFHEDMQNIQEQEIVEDIQHAPEPVAQDDVDNTGDDVIDDIADEIVAEVEAEPVPETGDSEEEREPSLHIPLHEDPPSREEREKVLAKCTVKELRDYISNQWDMETTGVKKAQLIQGILALEYEGDDEDIE